MPARLCLDAAQDRLIAARFRPAAHQVEGYQSCQQMNQAEVERACCLQQEISCRSSRRRQPAPSWLAEECADYRRRLQWVEQESFSPEVTACCPLFSLVGVKLFGGARTLPAPVTGSATPLSRAKCVARHIESSSAGEPAAGCTVSRGCAESVPRPKMQSAPPPIVVPLDKKPYVE